MAIVRDWAVRTGPALLAWLPAALVATAALGYWGTTANPFNPLQLQNAATFEAQLWNIGLYYLVLLPFFFLTGLYISLVFVLNAGRVNLVYGYDLTGAGAGAAAVLGLMTVLHPFQLAPALLVPLAATALLGRIRIGPAALALAALVASEAVLLLDNRAAYNDFKGIYAPLHTPDAKVLAEVRSPRGLYALLDDFTERVDVDVSNNAGMMGLPGPPASVGVYRDGSRIGALPKEASLDAAYAPALLDALPYTMRPGGRVLLAGASGGFRIRQALALGAAEVVALEPDPVLRALVAGGAPGLPGLASDPRVRLLPDSPLAAVRGAKFDLIDLAADFLEAGEANGAAFTAESLAADLRALKPGGVLSVPVSIRELPVYAVRVLATVREALRQAGALAPAENVIVYRSAWNVRILASLAPWSTSQVEAARAFCDERSFDLSYYPGIDPVAARASIYNDLPAVNFESGEVSSSTGASDAVADEAGPVLRGEASESQAAFNLAPITLDRPAFYSILRLNQVPNILRRVEILPQPEVGQLVNLAVLGQAIVLALLVLAVPLLAPRVAAAAEGERRPAILRPVVYFASLGLGFLFIEIVLIEKASFYLNDRTSAFALVLTGMLVFSGLGSLLAERAGRAGIVWVGGAIVAWCLVALVALEPLLLATIGLPWAGRAGILLLVTAPVSVALGMPFPMGLARAGRVGQGQGGQGGSAFLPWAWGLNGAFSVVATPLANLVAVQSGFDRVLLCAAMLYVTTILSFPASRKSFQWQAAPSRSPVAPP